MQYMLLIYGDEAARGSATKEQIGQMYSAYGAYTEAMKKAGVYQSGNPLQGVSTATTVRAPEGKTKVLNGPYAETKEQLGGYYLIEAASIDEAASIASGIPAARYGSIEVRPIMVFS
jgi:hypothetical protein